MKQFFSLLRVICLLSPLILTSFCSTCDDEPIKPPPPATIDSSSHAWRFELDTLGGYNSGAHDVVAFSENDAYVAGEFLVYPDPSDIGNWEIYNLAHWDGKKWTLLRIGPYPYYGGTMYALNNNFIILEVYDNPYLWNGIYWFRIYIKDKSPFRGISGIWAKNPTEVHMIGGGGTWFIWDGYVGGGNFQRIQTPTTIDLRDIYGDGDVVYACGRDPVGNRSVILKYDKGKVMVVDSAITPGQIQISAIWYNAKDNLIATAGNKNRIFDGTWKEATTFYNYLDAVRGSSRTNVWWAGNFLSFMHYNGSTIKGFKKPFPQSGVLECIDVHESFFFASGRQYMQNGDARGVVIRGYKVK